MSSLRDRVFGFIAAPLAFAALALQTSSLNFVTATPASAQTSSRTAPSSCPITKPPQPPFVPPAPCTAKLCPHCFWFGTEKLWTFLGIDGTWNGLPHYTPDDPTFRQKLFFWRAGFDARSEPEPALTITGKRLDAPAPPLASDQANAGWQTHWQTRDQPFMVTGINIPTLGCWEITAHYQGQDVTFVVHVTQDPPSSE